MSEMLLKEADVNTTLETSYLRINECLNYFNVISIRTVCLVIFISFIQTRNKK